jgi:hypothetical protein
MTGLFVFRKRQEKKNKFILPADGVRFTAWYQEILIHLYLVTKKYVWLPDFQQFFNA